MIDRDKLKHLLAPYNIYNDTFLDEWSSSFETINLDTDKTIIRAGDEQRYFYIIEQGLVRYYYTSPEGKEWNKAFFADEHFAGSLSAYITNQPCRFTIETLEPSLLYRTPIKNFRTLTHQYPDASNIIKALSQAMFIRNELREDMLLTCNAEQRYRWLEQNESWLLKRGIAQYHIASYLSMDAVSLSRIKKKLDARC